MPQIDEKDIPRLLVWLGQQGVSISAGYCSAEVLTLHQDVDIEKAQAMVDAVLHKPILKARDNAVLDGNHRAFRHILDRTKCPFIQIETDFAHALSLLAAFPYTYELSSATPERN